MKASWRREKKDRSKEREKGARKERGGRFERKREASSTYTFRSAKFPDFLWLSIGIEKDTSHRGS